MSRRSAGSRALAVPVLLLSVPPITRDAAREAARRELSRAVYRSAEPPLWARLLGRALRALAQLLAWAEAVSPGGLVGLLGLVVLLLLAVVVIRLRVGPLARSGGRPGPARLGAARSALDHRRVADEHASAGRYAEAVRERLRAIVRELEDRGVLDPRPGRTAREVAAEAGAAVPPLRPPLRGAAVAFDEIWYGGRAATAADDARLREVDRRVQATRLAVPAEAP